MKYMRWSWAEYQSTPVSVVEAVVDQMKAEHEQRKQAALQSTRSSPRSRRR